MDCDTAPRLFEDCIIQCRTILVLRLIPDKESSKALPLFIAMRGISNNFLVHLPSWHEELRVCKGKTNKITLNVSKCYRFGENFKFGDCFTTSMKTGNLLLERYEEKSHQREVTRKRMKCSKYQMKSPYMLHSVGINTFEMITLWDIYTFRWFRFHWFVFWK